MNLQEQLDADIDEWTKLKDWLAIAKAREAELRAKIAAAMFEKLPNGTFPEGTSTKLVAGSASNYSGKLSAKLIRDIQEELLIPTLTEANLTPDEAKGLIRGKPELGLVAYRNLPESKRTIIDRMLVVKPGSITLEVIPVPK